MKPRKMERTLQDTPALLLFLSCSNYNLPARIPGLACISGDSHFCDHSEILTIGGRPVPCETFLAKRSKQ